MKTVREWLSLVADVLQVVGFVWGLVAVGATAIGVSVVGSFTQIPMRDLFIWGAVACLIVLAVVCALVPQFSKIPMDKAARVAYERTRGGLWAEAAERMRVDKTPEGILDYMATGLAPHVAVFGVYPPSTKQQLVPAQEVKRGSFKKGATILKLCNKQESTMSRR